MTLRAGSDLSSGSDSAVVAHVAPVLPRASLTPRQREVVAAVATGLTNKEVAYQLGISKHTVDVHITDILAKLHLDNRMELARWWLGHFEGTCSSVLARCTLPAGHDGEHQALFR